MNLYDNPYLNMFSILNLPFQLLTLLGRWFYLPTAAGYNATTGRSINQRFRKQLQKDPSQLILGSFFCFKPFAKMFGYSEAQLTGGIYDSLDKMYVTTSELVLNATVENRNDPPVISKSTLSMPEPLAFNLTAAHDNETGFTVEQVLSGFVTDSDFDDSTNKIGMCCNFHSLNRVRSEEIKCET